MRLLSPYYAIYHIKSFLYFSGVCPVCFLKWVIKLLVSENPHCYAISATVLFVERNSIFA